MRIGSLFSGYGGLDLAALELFPGSEVAWHCEWEAAPSRILAHHWPSVPNFHDVTKLDWDALPPIDILTGGYPCQPFSAAGRRKGTADERHLWPYVLHAIRRLRPRFTLLENVAGHRSMGFDRVLGDCAEDGLHVRWTSVRASDVGACHRRERLFILVTHPDYESEYRERACEESQQGSQDASNADSNSIRVESVSEPGGLRQAEFGRVGANVADSSICGLESVDDRPGGSSARGEGGGQFGGSAGRATSPVALLPTPSTADGMGGHLSRSGARSSELLLPGVVKAHAEGKLLPTPRTSDGMGGPDPLTRHERMDDVETRLIRLGEQWGAYEAAIRRQELLSRPAPSPTRITAKGNPRLDPPFPEWMMFLPQGHVTSPEIGLSNNDQLKAIGNGVCPPQAVAAYRPMLQAVMA